MPAARRALLAALPVLLSLAGPVRAAPPRVTLRGTYLRIARDGHPDQDVLLTGDHHYPVRLPAGVAPGTRLTVTADSLNDRVLKVRSLRTLAGPSARPAATVAPTVTRVLVILGYWTAPDSVTTARAKAQVVDDDGAWFREVSYGAVGLTGAATPWLRITAPTNGRCYDFSGELMASAKARAKAAGFDPAGYDRTVLYFPRCSGADTVNVAGWAYEPGASVWLNGYLDRRTSVHEQGHNYGMGHAHALACTSGGVRVPLAATCTRSEYGDPYDAMGQSAFVAHYSAYNKAMAGWLDGRKRVLTAASSTFALPPFERPSSAPLAVVVNSPVRGRAYWLEYRRPTGYDAALPAGATGGVLVHVVDPPHGDGAMLLDGTPADASFGTAVLRAGTAWTSPDGVRIAIGTVSATGANVTVTGARPQPTPPAAVRSVTADAGDASVTVRWAAPLSDGGEPVTTYTVDVTGAGGTQTQYHPVDAGNQLVVNGLANDTAYTFDVRALNAVGAGPPGRAAATPVLMAPTVRLAAPADAATVGRTVTLEAAAAPHPVSQRAIAEVAFYADGAWLGAATHAPWSIGWRTEAGPNGRYALRATARDTAGRVASSETVTVTVDNPVPEVVVTTPASSGPVDVPSMTFEAAATVPARSTATVTRVVWSVNGWTFATATAAPFRATLDLRSTTGPQSVTATAYDSAGLAGRSAPVTFTVVHPPPSGTLTAPRSGTHLSGAAQTLTADAAARTSGATVARVVFVVDYGVVAEDTTAPYEAVWDAGAARGGHLAYAVVYDSNGRTATTATSGFTLDNVLPAVAITAPASVADPAPQTLSGTAAPAAGGAAVDRVVVTMDGAALPVMFAGGTWTAPWDATGRYGYHTLAVTAYDAAGLRSSATRWVRVDRPLPVVTFRSPGEGAVLVAGAGYELAVTAEPGPYDPATVLSVCFFVDYGYGVGCGTRGPDGVYRVAWNDAQPGRGRVAVTVAMSDGSQQYVAGPHLAVLTVPAAPTVTAYPGWDGSVTVGWSSADSWTASVTSYVVSLAGGETRTVTGPDPVTFTGLTNGTTYAFTVAAVNVAGTGPPGQASAMPGTPTYAGTVSSGPYSFVYGGRFSVTAAPRPMAAAEPITGRPAEVVACATAKPADCAVVARGVTGTDGRVTLSFVPVRASVLTLRFAGGGRYLESSEGLGAVTVASKVTGTLSASAVPAGGTATLSGAVSPARPGGFVYLQRLYGGAWHDVTYRTQSAAGAVAVPVKVPRGTYVYRLRYGAVDGRLPGVSPSRTLTVA
jgi:hypothetical protein